VRYAALEDHPRGAAPPLFEADHVSHAKVMSSCEEALEQLDEEGPDLRRRVVLILPLFFRLKNVLEHHTLREQRFLYPRLDAELSEEELAAAVRALSPPRES
jgi:hemerythrin-like domain-containing protein